MIKSILLLRTKQAYRALKNAGLGRSIILLSVVAFGAFWVYKQIPTEPNEFYVVGGMLATLLFIQLKRKDQKFLKTHFYNFKIILGIEYLILSTPVIVSLAIHCHWYLILYLILGITAVVNVSLKLREQSINTKLQELIPYAAFEWKAGVRKSLFFIIAVWVVSIVTAFFPGSIPIAIFVLGVIIFSFLDKSEPLPMLLSYELSPRRLLYLKIKLQVILFSILTAPLLILFFVFHPDIWYIPAAEFIIFVSLQVYVVLVKYAFYKPNESLGAAQVFTTIGVIGIFMPFFIPLMWILSVHFFIKSQKNLKPYLDDFNS